MHAMPLCLLFDFIFICLFCFRIASTEKLDVFAKTDLKFEEKGCLFNAKTYFVIRYLLFFTIGLICAIHPAKIRSTDFWYSLNYNGRSYLTFQVAKWGHQDIAFWTHSLRTFKLSVHATGIYKKDWNRKLSTEWENKCKQRNVDSWMECENPGVLGWKWYASFTIRNTDNF